MDKEAAATAILAQALRLAPFDGWNARMLEQAAKDAGYPASDVVRVFPNAARDALEAWSRHTDTAQEAAAKTMNLPALKIRERIAALVLWRLDHLLPHREAVRKSVGYFASPFHLPHALEIQARSMDLMWRLAGDASTDYNWYTKRMLLAGVYGSTLLTWLDDDSPEQEETSAFLKRRIENALALGKLPSMFKKKA